MKPIQWWWVSQNCYWMKGPAAGRGERIKIPGFPLEFPCKPLRIMGLCWEMYGNHLLWSLSMNGIEHEILIYNLDALHFTLAQKCSGTIITIAPSGPWILCKSAAQPDTRDTNTTDINKYILSRSNQCSSQFFWSWDSTTSRDSQIRAKLEFRQTNG